MDDPRRTTTRFRRGLPTPAQAPDPARTTSWILRERGARPKPPPTPAPFNVSGHGDLPLPVLDRISGDPLFQLMTADRTHWICPYTGRAISAPNGRTEAARTWLEQSGVWRNLEPLSARRLQIERWRHHITSLLAHEPRLRLFSRQGRGWLNPYTGELVPDVDLIDGQFAPKTVTRMAEVLANCPEASGPMLSEEEIQRRAASLPGSGSGTRRPPTREHIEHTDTTEVVWLDDPETTRATSEDLTQARRVQERSLSELPKVEGISLGVHFAPCAGVSGDFYHVATLPDGRLFLAVGDVSGHGVQAALVVASAVKTLRFVLRAEQEPVDVILTLNDELRSDLLPGQFISLFVALLDPRTRELTAVCAGHHPAILVNPNREQPVQRIGKAGMALGLGDRSLLGRLLKPVTLTLEPGDILTQVTDGLLEAHDAQRRQWGEARWMASVLAQHDETQAQALADRVVRDLKAFSPPPIADDLLVLVLALEQARSN
jgi:hypothetical protein